MKNYVLLMLCFIGFAMGAESQNLSRHALGLRFGDNDGFRGEISYQREIGQNVRLELDLGLKSDSGYGKTYKLSGIYQWVFLIDGGFNWYIGGGAIVGSWNPDSDYIGNRDDGVFVNAAGNIGIEYDFDIPLLVSLDYRPEVGIIGDSGSIDVDISLALRYQFW